MAPPHVCLTLEAVGARFGALLKTKRDLTGEAPTRLQPSDLASQPKAGEPNFSPSNFLLATGAGRTRSEACWLPSYTLVVLKDLGVDPRAGRLAE